MKLEQAARQALEALEDIGGFEGWTEVKNKAITALREALAEQAEQEPVDHIGIKHDAQLVDTFLRCPMTGKQLYFASEPIQKNEMNYILLQDDEGNDWTLIARLDEGWDGK